ncbi:hypothetical protein BH10BAC5_BH10BAC5_18100 [soil metagenome]
MIISLLAGVVLGFVISIPPLGPTYFAIAAKAFEQDKKGAIAIGFGASFVDFFYILLIYGGITGILSLFPPSLENLIENNQNYIKIVLTFIGCIVVFVFGLKLIRSRATPIQEIDDKVIKEKNLEASKKIHKTGAGINKILHTKKLEEDRPGFLGGFLSGMLLCFSSVTLPASWVIMVGYLKGLGVISSGFASGIFFGVGVFGGALLWFYSLTILITSNSHKIKPGTLNKINTVTGYFLLALGLFLLYKAIDFLILANS